MAANTASKAGTPRPGNLKNPHGYLGMMFGTTDGQFADGSAYGFQAQGTDGVVYCGMPDNQAAALVFQEAANAYLTFVTTNSSEAVKISKTLDLDGEFDFDGATFDVVSAGAFSIDGTGESNVSATSGNLTLSTITSGDVIITSAGGTIEMDDLVQLDAAGGTAAANALLMGIGTSGDPATTATANKDMVELRCQSTATSGDFRGIYVRTDIAGAGGAGESVRGNTVINAASGGTVNGGHFSSEVKTGGGSVVGQATGVRAGFIVPNAALSGGTVYGALCEIYSGGSSSNVSGATKHAILGIAASGDAAGAANVLNAMSFDGNDASGDMIYENVAAYANWAGSIRILVNGNVRYLKYDSTEA